MKWMVYPLLVAVLFCGCAAPTENLENIEQQQIEAFANSIPASFSICRLADGETVTLSSSGEPAPPSGELPDFLWRGLQPYGSGGEALEQEAPCVPH